LRFQGFDNYKGFDVSGILDFNGSKFRGSGFQVLKVLRFLVIKVFKNQGLIV
jgi:hypothetical protein